MVRSIVLGLVPLLWLSSLASAQSSRVVVNDFQGAQAAQVRKAVLALLDDNSVEVVPTKKAEAMAKRTGAELDTESGRVRVAKKLKLTGFLDGQVQRQRRTLKINLTVYGGRDGMPSGQLNLSAPKGAAMRELKTKFWGQLGPALSGTVKSAEPEFEIVEPEPEPEAKPVAAAPAPVAPRVPVEDSEVPPDLEPPAAEEVDEETSVAAGPALDINVGASFGTRRFAYSDPMPGLRDYNLSLSPNLGVRVRWFPVAHFEGGTMSNIGLDLRGEMLVGVSSTNRTGEKFATNSSSFGVGLRARVPMQTLELGAVLGYGRHSFGLEGTSRTDPDVPDVGYGFLRAGLDLRWRFAGPFTLGLAAAYLYGLSHGEIAERAWFPHTSGGGIEGELSFGWSLSKVLGVEASFGLERYFMSFDPRPEDPGVRGPGRVAGGALDQYLSSKVGMVIRL